MNLKGGKCQPGALTASYACTDENLLSQIEQDGCHAEDVFMCCRRASLLLKYRFSHWGQVGILVESGTQYKKERKGGQRRGAALSDEESMGKGKEEEGLRAIYTVRQCAAMRLARVRKLANAACFFVECYVFVESQYNCVPRYQHD